MEFEVDGIRYDSQLAGMTRQPMVTLKRETCMCDPPCSYEGYHWGDSYCWTVGDIYLEPPLHRANSQHDDSTETRGGTGRGEGLAETHLLDNTCGVFVSPEIL